MVEYKLQTIIQSCHFRSRRRRRNMFNVICPKWDGTFSRRDVMLRHLWNIHGTCQPYPHTRQLPSPPPPSQDQGFVFKHPFTANVSGPTSSDKTFFVKMLLQNCMTWYIPPFGYTRDGIRCMTSWNQTPFPQWNSYRGYRWIWRKTTFWIRVWERPLSECEFEKSNRIGGSHIHGS